MSTTAISSAPSATIRVLIVDDHPSFGHGLSALISVVAHDIEVIAVATNLEAAIEDARAHVPDVMIMDLRLPEGNELEFMRQVKEDLPETKLLILTGSGDAERAREALTLGVNGFLFKDVEVEDLVAAVRVVDRGGTVLSPTVLETVLAPPSLRSASVTEWEVDVLKLVAEGLDNNEIAGRLTISQSTLKRNLRVIEDKLGARNRVDAAVQAARLGFI